MQYTYFRKRPFDEDEQDRRRASALALLYLYLRFPIRTVRWARALLYRPHHVGIIEKILHQGIRCEAPLNSQILTWVLAYAHPALLRAIIKSLRKREPASWAEKVLIRANEKLLLPCEYLAPEFQKMRTSSRRSEKVLVCFTGAAQRLNMPVQLFHFAVAERFDVLLYLRDFERQRFIYGVPGLGENIGEVASALRQHIPDGCHLSVLGTSGGGLAATRVAESLQADRLALFSPGYRFKDVRAISRPGRLDSKNVLLYFSTYHKKDKELVRQWQETTLASSIRLLDTELHGTLSYIVNADHFEEVMTWLSGRPSPELERFHTHEHASVAEVL